MGSAQIGMDKREGLKRPTSATSLGLGQRGETSNLVRDLCQTPGGPLSRSPP
jgi:hypothetical protein